MSQDRDGYDRLSLGERKLLRRKYGPVLEQGMENKN